LTRASRQGACYAGKPQPDLIFNTQDSEAAAPPTVARNMTQNRLIAEFIYPV